MAAPKQNTWRALLAKAEASYLGGGSVAAADDGILLAGPITPTLTYLHDGSRRQPPGMAGNMRRVAPSGAELAFPIVHEMKGAGSAYSASVTPSGHRLILASGFDGAVTTTGGSEKWDYTPTPFSGTPTSLVCELYEREEKWPVTGVYLNLESIEWADQGVPLWTFQARGVPGTIADSAIPSVTYPFLTGEPPKAVNIGLTIGDFTTAAVSRSGRFAMNRTLSPRANQNASAGHKGFTPGRRNPTLEVVIEATAFVNSPYHTSAGLNPYLLYEAATEVAFSVTFGSVQYNRIKLITADLQMTAPPTPEEDGDTALWRCMFQMNPSSVNNSDDVTIRAD
jgi:hypothetical protein